jgi:hypothetical protein
MSIQISDVFELCQRSLFHALRKGLVELGYLPDIELFPNTAVGYANYQTAIKSVVQTKGFAIEIFGVGSSENKYIKKVPRIVLKSGRMLGGDIGNSPQPLIEQDPLDNDTFIKRQVAPTTTDYEIEVRLTYNSAKQERVMMGLMGAVVSKRAYIPRYNDPDKKLFIQFSNHIDFSDAKEGYAEHVYTYLFKDLYEMDGIVLSTGIKKVNEIIVEVKQDGPEPTTTLDNFNVSQ